MQKKINLCNDYRLIVIDLTCVEMNTKTSLYPAIFSSKLEMVKKKIRVAGHVSSSDHNIANFIDF